MTSVPAFESSADPNPNAETMKIAKAFFTMRRIPSVVSRIEPDDRSEVAEDSAMLVNRAAHDFGYSRILLQTALPR